MKPGPAAPMLTQCSNRCRCDGDRAAVNRARLGGWLAAICGVMDESAGCAAGQFKLERRFVAAPLDAKGHGVDMRLSEEAGGTKKKNEC